MAEISKINVTPPEVPEYRLDLTKTEAVELLTLIRNGVDSRTYTQLPTLRTVRDGLSRLVEPRSNTFLYTAQIRGF